MSEVKKIAEAINKKRRAEVFNIYSNYRWFNDIIEARKKGTYSKAGKAMKKVASVPIEVDHFFSKIYGEDYYKDPAFFVKRHSEWALNHNPKEVDPGESAKFVKKAFTKQREEDINTSRKKV